MKLLNLLIPIILFFTMLPLNYFFQGISNSLPIQVVLIFICSILLYNNNFKNLTLFFVSFIILLMCANLDFINLIYSATSASFLVFWIILSCNELKNKYFEIDKLNKYFFYLIVIFTLYFNVDFLINDNSLQRSKGFGSGTIYSLISIYGFIYLYKIYISNSISKFKFYFIAALFILTFILTMSRGVFITLILVLLFYEFKVIKEMKLFRFLSIIFLISIFFYNSNFIDRFYATNYFDFESLTSGRSSTQLYIIRDFLNEKDFVSKLFGNGLNSIKINLVTKGFEFPHFDILFLLYEGGIVLLTLYIVTLVKIFRKFNSRIFFWIFILSSFHTNMLLSPGFLYVSLVLDSQVHYKLNIK